ncbi:unnamed protein product [Adineta ricciae]|uniref:Uncharacterized protein n=1 Tax=Adineta ricciae TaxID=249248 RepID=A0A813Y582_ADIRI|nr:unnamed protein product [Adineta ricciae]CAF1297350.1 unnamed protein product [Adineta ricciae]
MPFLWQTCLGTHECNKTIIGQTMTFTCPQNVSNPMLQLSNFTSDQLENITVFIAQGLPNPANASQFLQGPFTSIPPNICMMPNLITVIFANNQINNVDPTGYLSECFSSLVTLDLSYNQITMFPSYLIYNTPTLKNLYFQHNNLTEVPANAFSDISTLEIINFAYNQLTAVELWTLDVKTNADFSYNQITSITNKYLYSSITTRSMTGKVSLTGNGPTINFTDVVYEMYNQCDEVIQWYFEDNDNPPEPYFTKKLGFLDFGTTVIDCSCAQLYFLKQATPVLSGSNIYPVLNTMCSNSSQNNTYTRLFNSSCANSLFDRISTAPFTQTYPRFCRINESGETALTVKTNMSAPSFNASAYPHYATVDMNPGTCFFTFTNLTTVNIQCTIDTSNNASRIPAALLSNTSMSSVTRVTFMPAASSLPTYLCSLPSRQIDLSYQAFTALSDATFPCLDYFTKVSLSHNMLTSVSISNGNFKNLTSLDLSSNMLTMIPYSVLTPTPTSLNYLDLRNNSITYLDFFIYTRKNITINLDNNPINVTNILNPQNSTLVNQTSSTATIMLPESVTDSTVIIDDSTVIAYGLCNDFQTLSSILTSLDAATNIQLNCNCSSINLKQLYQAQGMSITDSYPCANEADTASFRNLTVATCPSSASFSNGLCSNTTSTNTTTTTTTTTTTAATGGNGTTTNTTTTAATGGNGTTTNTTTTAATGGNGTTTTTATTAATGGNGTTTTTATTAATGGNGTTTTTATTAAAGGNGTTTTTATTAATGGNGTTTTTTSASVSNTSSTNVSGSAQGGSGLQSSDQNSSDSNRTGLIVGLVVGIVGFLILLAALIAAVLLYRYCRGGGGGTEKRRVSRTAVKGSTKGDGQAPGVTPSDRFHSRNSRGVKLAPISSTSSQFPTGPVGTVVPSSTNLTAPVHNPIVRGPVRGIPLRPLASTSSIGSPTTTTLGNPAPLHLTSSSPMSPSPFTQPHAPRPILPHMLNTGGSGFA